MSDSSKRKRQPRRQAKRVKSKSYVEIAQSPGRVRNANHKLEVLFGIIILSVTLIGMAITVPNILAKFLPIGAAFIKFGVLLVAILIEAGALGAKFFSKRAEH